jgi:hypothetical protein
MSNNTKIPQLQHFRQILFWPYPNSPKVRKILQELQKLTKLFVEVSTLGQAKKLFNLWEHHLGIKDSLERALKETQDIHERLEIEEQKQQTDTTVRLTVVATIGLMEEFYASKRCKSC